MPIISGTAGIIATHPYLVVSIRNSEALQRL